MKHFVWKWPFCLSKENGTNVFVSDWTDLIFGSVFDLTSWYWGQNIKQWSKEGYTGVTAHSWETSVGLKYYHNKWSVSVWKPF